MLLKVTLSGPSVRGSGPNKLGGTRAPCTPGATPVALIVAKVHGDKGPGWPPAALEKLFAVRVGPSGTVVSEKDTDCPPALAVTVTPPAVAPAVRVTWALPVVSVFTVVDVCPPIVAGPLTEK